jgi:hypothetical protein
MARREGYARAWWPPAAARPPRVGRDGGRTAEKIVSHPSGPLGAKVTAHLEVRAVLPDGAPDHIVRIVRRTAARSSSRAMGSKGTEGAEA